MKFDCERHSMPISLANLKIIACLMLFLLDISSQFCNTARRATRLLPLWVIEGLCRCLGGHSTLCNSFCSCFCRRVEAGAARFTAVGVAGHMSVRVRLHHFSRTDTRPDASPAATRWRCRPPTSSQLPAEPPRLSVRRAIHCTHSPSNHSRHRVQNKLH